MFGATEQKFPFKGFKNTVHTFFFLLPFAPAASFLRRGSVALGRKCYFETNLTIFNVFTSNFSELTFKIANPSDKPQDSHPVVFIFYFLSSSGFQHSIRSTAPPLALGQGVN